MVKTIYLILLLSTLSQCMTHRVVLTNNNCGIEFHLYTDKLRPNDSLALIVKNNNNFPVEVSDFSFLANTLISLKDGFDNRLSWKVRIKIDFSCREEFVPLGPGETKRFIYSVTIAKLYDVILNNQYKLKITYHGFVKINNRRNQCSNIVFEDWVTFLE